MICIESGIVFKSSRRAKRHRKIFGFEGEVWLRRPQLPRNWKNRDPYALKANPVLKDMGLVYRDSNAGADRVKGLAEDMQDVSIEEVLN